MDGNFALTFLLLAPLDADGAEERHLCLSFDPPKCHKQPIWRILLNATFTHYLHHEAQDFPRFLPVGSQHDLSASSINFSLSLT